MREHSVTTAQTLLTAKLHISCWLLILILEESCGSGDGSAAEYFPWNWFRFSVLLKDTWAVSWGHRGSIQMSATRPTLRPLACPAFLTELQWEQLESFPCRVWCWKQLTMRGRRCFYCTDTSQVSTFTFYTEDPVLAHRHILTAWYRLWLVLMHIMKLW